MADYRVHGNGAPTSAEDPKRSVWWGMCGHWTDDWALLNKKGVPRCPKCNCPGMYGDFGGWWKAAEDHAETHPGYLDELNKLRLSEESNG